MADRRSRIQGPQTLDPGQTYTVTNSDGSTFTGGGAQASEWANYWADDPTSGMGTGKGYTSENPGRDVFSNWGGAADVSFEHMIRHFTNLTSRFAPRRTAGPNDDEVPPPAFIEWGEGSDFYEEDTPSNPVEDLNADAYGMPTSSGSVPSDLSSGGIGSPSFASGTNSGLPGTTNMTIGAGMTLRPRPRKPQDHRPGVTTFEEIDRQVQRGLVFNPKDREQYVIVERILSIRFRGKDGAIMKFNMKPPPFPPSPEDPPDTP